MNKNDYRLNAYRRASETASGGSVGVGRTDSKSASAGARQNAIRSGGLLKSAAPARSDGESLYRRVAKFLVLIGTDEASKVLQFLPQSDVEKIIPEIASIRSVSSDEAEAIFEEFRSIVEEQKSGGGENAAFDILEKAFGQSQAREMMERLAPKIERERPFAALDDRTPEEVLSILKGEPPSVVAIVLSRLEPSASAAIINSMDEEQKKETVLRLAKIQNISPDVIDSISRTIQKKAAAQVRDNSVGIDGRGALLQILRRMDFRSENAILSSIEKTDPSLRADLQEGLFTLEDVLNCNDRFLQDKLRSMSDKDIAFLIADKDGAFQKKIFDNVSTGRGDRILEEESAAKPMRRRDVDEVTNAFLQSLRKSWQEGDLILDGMDEELII